MIEHEGIIEHIDGDVAHVKIDSVSACASCHARGACGAADQEEKYLDIPLHGAAYEQGSRFMFRWQSAWDSEAVPLGYVYPFLLLMAGADWVILPLASRGAEGQVSLPCCLSFPITWCSTCSGNVLNPHLHSA